MAEDKSHLVDASSYGAYDTSYTPSPHNVPIGGTAPPSYDPNYSIQGHEMFSTGPPMTTSGVVVHNTVPVNNMYREAGQMPPNYIVHNILILLFCSLIFGIIGLVKGSQVSSLYISGNYAAAEAASRDAKKWYQVGLVVGCIVKAALITFLVVIAFV